MNWYPWARNTLVGNSSVVSDVPANRIFAAGSVEGRPPTRFIVLRFGPEVPRVGDAIEQELQVWIHDEPGSYDAINNCLSLTRTALEAGPIAVQGAIACNWNGNSADLADDGFNTLARYASYLLIGRK
jgi:hypothetical protein